MGRGFEILSWKSHIGVKSYRIYLKVLNLEYKVSKGLIESYNCKLKISWFELNAFKKCG